MTNYTIKLKADNEKELKGLIDWYKKRFPNYTKKDLNKFKRVVLNQNTL